MTQQAQFRAEDEQQIERDADALERKFGELATTYAENRSEAAELRGSLADAEHWREVKEEIEEDDGQS